MAYSSGGLIQATDYNGFVSNTSNANINDIWATGAGDKGYGQSSLATVPVGGVVTAAQWATLVNTISSIANHQGTSITPRTAPTVGNIISILNDINTDINALTVNRGRAAAVGAVISDFSGTVSKTAATASGAAAWSITFTQTITFASANAARYFFNAGGLVKIMYGKTSTGTDHDPDWNQLVAWAGDIYFTGRVAGTSQVIAGTTYTGTNRTGGTGGTQTTLSTTTGFYNLTPGAAALTLFQLNNSAAPYTPEFIRTQVSLNAGGNILTFTTVWFDDGTAAAGTTSAISGGTATTSPATSITGTAPTTLINLIAPSTSHLSASWGTPAIASSVV